MRVRERRIDALGEFIENVPRDGRSDAEYKQDCELAGAKRP